MSVTKSLPNVKTVKVNSLILDYDLYPRTSIDSQAVSYLVQALEADAILPPIIIDKKTRKVIDGFHRCKAHLRHFGDEADIDAEERTYAKDGDAFLDAIQLNSNHGSRLDRHDRVHCLLKAKELKISKSLLPKALNMSMKVIETLLKERTAFLRQSGKQTTLKQTIKHMHGRNLTQEQQEANKKLSGMKPVFYVNQIITLIENDFIDPSDDKFFERLEVLQELAGKILKSRK